MVNDDSPSWQVSVSNLFRVAIEQLQASHAEQSVRRATLNERSGFAHLTHDRGIGGRFTRTPFVVKPLENRSATTTATT
jgi:hypothetical protein